MMVLILHEMGQVLKIYIHSAQCYIVNDKEHGYRISRELIEQLFVSPSS